MLEPSMVASATDRVRSSSSILSEPANLAKRPRTLETTMWRIEKLMPDWATSMFLALVLLCFLRRALSNASVPQAGLAGQIWKNCPTGGTIGHGPQRNRSLRAGGPVRQLQRGCGEARHAEVDGQQESV